MGYEPDDHCGFVADLGGHPPTRELAVPDQNECYGWLRIEGRLTGAMGRLERACM